MLRVAYHDPHQGLLVDGRREDYEQLAALTLQLLGTGAEATLGVTSVGPVPVSAILLRRVVPPNRVSFDCGHIIICVAPQLERQFLSFIQFPANCDLPNSPIRYHHHYDSIGDDGTHVATDSLPVVFSLERNDDRRPYNSNPL